MLELIMVQVNKVSVEKTCAFVEYVVVWHRVKKISSNQGAVSLDLIFYDKGKIAEAQ